MGGARAFDASGAGDGSGADGQGPFDPQTLSVRRCRRSAQPPFKASRSEAEFRVRAGGRQEERLSEKLHSSEQRTDRTPERSLRESLPWRAGSEQLTFVPSFPARPGSPCSPGGPGGPGWPRSPIGPVSPVGPCGKHRHQPHISGDSHGRGLLFLNLTTAARCQAHVLTFHETFVCLSAGPTPAGSRGPLP